MTLFGAYVGNETSNLSVYEAWMNRPVDTLLSFINQSSWKGFEDSIHWGLDLWSDADRPVIWSVPLTVDGSPLRDGAAGLFDKHYRSAATAIAESRTDDGPIYVRIGWEFNGDWMPWSAGGHEADFISTFRRAADIFHQTSDRFEIVWDVNIGGGTIDPSTAYPGDAYVDVVGLDIYYNTLWDSTDPQAAFAFQVSRDYGLQWVADFAEARRKPLAVSEWGVESDTAGPYIKNLVDWMTDNEVLYANYWESNAGGFTGEMRTGRYPNSAKDFREAFGNGPKPDTLVLQVSGDSYDGDPQFVVSVDGRQVGGVQTAQASHKAGAFDTITLRGDFADSPSTVTVQFVNDAWGGSLDRDRNLYVEHIVVNGRKVAGDTAVNTAGTNANGVAVMGSNGTATFNLTPGPTSGTDTSDDILVLRVSGDSYDGAPQFFVTVDGRQIGDIQTTTASHRAGAHETITLRGDFGSSPSKVNVLFVNDAWGGRSDLDRNLYVEEVSLNGRKLAGDAAVNTAGTNLNGVAVMGGNGTASFDFSANAVLDTLTLKVSGDSYQGDPQFVVRVGGEQIGGVQTAKASHRAGAQDTITLRGDFGDAPGTVTVEFVNDAWGGRSDLDRNLYVEQIVLNGHVLAGGAAINTAGANANGVAIMGSNGTATFTVPSDWLA